MKQINIRVSKGIGILNYYNEIGCIFNNYQYVSEEIYWPVYFELDWYIGLVQF